MFKKKKTKDEYEIASEELNEPTDSASRIVTEIMRAEDEFARQLVDLIKAGHPLIINFEELDRFNANKYVAFFVGATYALDGKTIPINDKIYLFARRVDLLDGSVKKFLDEIPG